MTRLSALVGACLLCGNLCAQYDDTRTAVPLVIDGRAIPFFEFAIYLLPKQSFRVGFRDAAQSGSVTFAGGRARMSATALTAPERPGLYPLAVINDGSRERTTINVFVMVPAKAVDATGHLNGYSIGRYPRARVRGESIYLPPKGFVEVTQVNRETRLSPNFMLGQFVSKQSQGYPKYVVLRADLLLKLESILAALNASEHATPELVIMSGYRTPWYNRSIGNVAHSRHLWGGAADLYIDAEPQDGRMDDMNGDGKFDRGDARWLADFINRMSRRGDFGSRVGGMGVYGGNAAHGPFVHVDVRGSRARW